MNENAGKGIFCEIFIGLLKNQLFQPFCVHAERPEANAQPYVLRSQRQGVKNNRLAGMYLRQEVNYRWLGLYSR